MRNLFKYHLGAMALLMAEGAAAGAVAEAPTDTAKSNKSIVPSKYGDKYKGGGVDELAKFINDQCADKSGFVYASFFELCKKNGLPAEKVDHYATQVAEKRHGSQGRARMTLRNMLATLARKNGHLIGLDGNSVAISISKPPVSGAAEKAHEASTEKTAQGDASAQTAQPETAVVQETAEAAQ